jgi:spore germination protein YaaH
MKDIPKQKITIGVATYGYEYKVTPISGGYDYKFLWAFNPRYATDLAAQLGITPQRTSSGELSFIYRPQNVEPETNVNAASAFTSIAQAAGTALDQSFNLAWWSDAQAIKDKVALAKKLGVRGVSIFKIDGGADPNLFTVLP